MQTERIKFSQRLNAVLAESGFPETAEERQQALASLLSVSPEHVAEWLEGKSYPKTSKLVKLAKYMRVRSNWLLSGIGEKHLHEDEEQAFRTQLMSEHCERYKQRTGQRQGQQAEEDGVPLTREALELANAYMKLPYAQQVPLYKLITELARNY